MEEVMTESGLATESLAEVDPAPCHTPDFPVF